MDKNEFFYTNLIKARLWFFYFLIFPPFCSYFKYCKFKSYLINLAYKEIHIKAFNCEEHGGKKITIHKISQTRMKLNDEK